MRGESVMQGRDFINSIIQERLFEIVRIKRAKNVTSTGELITA